MLLDELFLAAFDFPPFPEFLFHLLYAVFYHQGAVLFQVAVSELLELFVTGLLVGLEANGFELFGPFGFPPLVKGFLDVGFPLFLLDLRRKGGDGVKYADGNHQPENDIVVDLESFQKILDAVQNVSHDTTCCIP